MPGFSLERPSVLGNGIFEVNPWGRRGSPLHQARIRQAEQALINRGWTTVSGGSLPERAVDIPGGGQRYPDLVMRRGSEQIAIQVGRTTAAGLPIPREQSALRDLRSTGNYKHVGFLRY
jgi:hypothetical protein